jgi:ABC-type multidrug transport system ATPase subunit
MLILKTEHLSKCFGRIKAVNDLNLEVSAGDIYGFLGLNGAGKTTTLRLLLGLIIPSGGNIWLFGQESKRHYLEIMRRVGALVETPVFYPYLSGRENLMLLAELGGAYHPAKAGLTKNVLANLLEQVGLADRADDKVRTYSQGMKQRLGIAQALLTCLVDRAGTTGPKLVMLDEPTNSLDPQGIAEIRALIKQFHQTYNVTFLISSHLLSEVELLCNRVGVIKEGQLIVQGTIKELLQETTPSYTRLGVTPLAYARELIKQLDWVQEVIEISDAELQVRCDHTRLAELNAYLVHHNIKVQELIPKKKGLEEYFMEKIS